MGNVTAAVRTGWPWAAFTMGAERGTLGGAHHWGDTVSSEEQWLPANPQDCNGGGGAWKLLSEGARLRRTSQ